MPTVKQARQGLWGTAITFVALLAFQFVVLLGARTLYAQEVDFSSVKAKWNTCAACHGNKAQGKPGFPSLNWMEEDYIVEALTDYKQMINRGDMSGIMFGQAATLTDDEIPLMSKYIKEISKDE
jgi:cytochrome c553